MVIKSGVYPKIGRSGIAMKDKYRDAARDDSNLWIYHVFDNRAIWLI